jgi:hypothetical protein
VIYASAPLTIVKALDEDADSQAYQVRTMAEMLNSITSGRGRIIGLTFPDNFQSTSEAGDPITVGAYLPHWINAVETAELLQHFDARLENITGSNVTIAVADDQVHPTQESRGHGAMFVLQMVNAVLTVCLVLVPQLIMVEKETHTLDALLVSPASFADLTIGKGLAGAFYGLVAVLIAILPNLKIIAHGWLLTSTLLSGVFFAVVLGLFLGLRFENFQQSALWMGVIILLAIAPALANAMITVKLPNALSWLLTNLPGGQLALLLEMSLWQHPDVGTAAAGLGIIWGWNLLIFVLVLWRLRSYQK